MNLSQLTQVATEAAIAAGQVIQKAIGEEVPVEEKQGGESYASQVVTAVDKAAEATILSCLLPTCEAFGLALLSEETEDDGSRFEKDFFWCVDPMDGTLPFIRKQPGFSVSIALVGKDGTPHIGVVVDPSTNTLYHAIRGEGAWKNNTPWAIQNTNDHLTYVTDRPLKDTPRAAEIQQFLQQQVEKSGLSGVQEISGGGAVLNAIRVLENGPACMLKFPKKEQGGGSIWDFAATACIFQAMGRPATNVDGGPLDLNRRDSTFMNHEGVLYLNT
ncbi:MAG: 3'(2'),5'-bisphosphate nucleotidase CysQ [Phaeodactylibacter xiamenensis]|uniref:Inositol monophosphatase n=1 Tax=Phaeodactylibacter xiamenensis TaxID=1524460 RepID=A0A098SA00_9BACT|nr:inositol monophosphatase family protein [Phaeodactylibacter xiamenensis]KGE88478.1 inositol monophosphatase [Phaeodactylibacter xiamenensis]MCR9054354.1 inositol monophosphatase [bacterium]